MTGEERVTYRSVLANREFAALVAAQGLSTLGDQLAKIAIAILVYERTGSAFAASATYAVSFLPYVIGGPVLSAISDRRPRIGVMVSCDLLRAPTVLALCVADLPLWTYFLVLAAVSLLSPPFDSARSAIQPDILTGDAYVVGSGLMNLVLQFAQVIGFVAGGALVTFMTARGAIAMDAATFLVSAGLVLGCVRPRGAAQARDERSSLLKDTRAGFAYVRSQKDMRRYLAFSVLSSIAMIAPEGLAVPTAHDIGGGTLAAGVLTAAVPAGVVIGGTAVLRLAPARRLQLLPVISVSGPTLLLLSPFVDHTALLTGLWVAAGTSACVSLIAAASYVQACAPELRSRAYGVAVTSFQAGQSGALLLAGWLAGPLGPRGAVASIAFAVLACLLLSPALSPRGHKIPQENRHSVRSTSG